MYHEDSKKQFKQRGKYEGPKESQTFRDDFQKLNPLIACAVSPLGPSPQFYRSKSRETDGQAGGKEKENKHKEKEENVGILANAQKSEI